MADSWSGARNEQIEPKHFVIPETKEAIKEHSRHTQRLRSKPEEAKTGTIWSSK